MVASLVAITGLETTDDALVKLAKFKVTDSTQSVTSLQGLDSLV